MPEDKGRLSTKFVLDKFEFNEAVRKEAEDFLRAGGSVADAVKTFGGHFEHAEFEKNVFLNEGIQELWDLAIAAGGTTAYNNANARVGVGSDNTAENATQTGLIDGTPTFKAMDATYPIRTNQTVDFRGTFGSGDANEAWNEFTVDNGNTRNKNLNRKVSAQGTKTSGQTWVLTISLTIT